MLRVASVPGRDCLIDPLEDAGDPRVDPWVLGVCAPITPRDHPNEGVSLTNLKFNELATLSDF